MQKVNSEMAYLQIVTKRLTDCIKKLACESLRVFRNN